MDYFFYQNLIFSIPQKAVKGQALADFLVVHLVLDNSPMQHNLLDEEVMQVTIKKV